MSIDRSVEAVVGIMVLMSVLLTQFVHPAFMWLTVIVGINVLQQSFTGFCPVAMGLHRAGMKSERELGASGRTES
jgi:hypothetical protein